MAEQSVDLNYETRLQQYVPATRQVNAISGQPSTASYGGHFRSFTTHGCFVQTASLSASCTPFGSNSNRAALLSGSATGLDVAKRMSLQDDARARRISCEIMKHRLYESVITIARPQRLSLGPPNSNRYRCSRSSRSTQSMPVTPFHGSQEVSPSSTHFGNSRMGGTFRFFSYKTTPKCMTPAEEDHISEEEPSEFGLASLLGRLPRQGSISRCHIMEGLEMEYEMTTATAFH